TAQRANTAELAAAERGRFFAEAEREILVWLDDLDEERDAVLTEARQEAAQIVASANDQARSMLDRAADLAEAHARRVIAATTVETERLLRETQTAGPEPTGEREHELRWHSEASVPAPSESHDAAELVPGVYTGRPQAHADRKAQSTRRHHWFRRRS